MENPTMKHTVKDVIYKAKRGRIYDEARPRFNCYAPIHTGKYNIVDCWPCDKNGNIHPGYNVSPVPVDTDNLGEAIGKFGENDDE